ncbi:MAG: SLBB domain-containing protein [Spirochaetaceae bacterium]|jgi:polysaccharide export outer membrane protein|nr:SLBB domain-containing protein [Spirochaetaceae bacterium]
MKKLLYTILLLIVSAYYVQSQDVLSTSNSSVSLAQLVQLRAAYVMVNTDYPVTPGDTYQVSYLISTEKVNLPFYIEGDYTINLAYFGKYNVKDKTFAELKFMVESEVLHAYPDSVPSVTITTPGTFNVQIKGEVKASILVPAWSFDRLSTIIKDKTTNYASMRNVEIKSIDGTSKNYDLFKSSRYGELEQDPFIKSGDEIIVHPYIKRIKVDGEVRRPGTYELLPDDTLSDVINVYADGLTSFADTERITINRLNSDNNEFGESLYLDISESVPVNYTLNDLDSINIAKKMDHQPVVYFQGAIGTSSAGTTVSNKIPYPIFPEEKLSSAVRILKEQFTAVSDIENAFIIRSSNGEKEMMDIQNLLLKGGSQNDTVLFDQDIIVIPFRQYIVYVGGQVTSPGAYPYIVNKTWDYYVGLAGGFNIDNHIGTGVRITDVYGSRYKKDERIIQPEDVIYAPLNHPLYWLREYGTDIALITTTIISTIVMINYIGSLDIPTPATE